MKLIACLYIDDDGLAGRLAIYDDPCSWPMCLHADLPLSPGEVATLLEYIAHGVTYKKSLSDAYRVSFRETEGGRLTFYREALAVHIKGELEFLDVESAYVAYITIPRWSVLVDMSNDWGDDLPDTIEGMSFNSVWTTTPRGE